MEILEISDINMSDDGTDYLIQLKLNADDKNKILYNNEQWKDCIDSAIIHVWVEHDVISCMDLSVFDGIGGWEDGISIETVFCGEDIDRIKDYVVASSQEEKENIRMARWKTQAEVAAIRKRYPIGSRLELDYMEEPGMPSGLKGIVDHTDDQGQLHMIWENGRSLALIPGADRFHRLPEPQAEETAQGSEARDMER